MALEDAAVAFREARQGDDLPEEAGLARHYLGGLEGPPEGARVDAGDSSPFQGLSCGGGLSPTLFGEREVELSLPDAARVGGRLAVTDQDQLSLGCVVEVRVVSRLVHMRRLYTEPVPGKSHARRNLRC